MKLLDALFGRRKRSSFARRLLQSYASDMSILRDSSYADWKDDHDRYAQIDVVARSRWFERHSALANRLARLFVDYTVGPHGLLCVPASSSERWNQIAARLWATSKDDLFVGPLGMNGWGAALSAIAWRFFFDGEVFVLLGERENGPALQVIERQNIMNPSSGNGSARNVIDGVEVDPQDGTPIAYHVKTRDGKTTRIPSKFMVHVYDPARAGEYRGMPVTAPILNDLHLLMDLELIEKRSLQNAADLSVVLKLNSGEIQDTDIRAMILGLREDTAEAAVDEVNRLELYRKIMGGRTIALQRDEDAMIVAPNRPTAEQREFWRYLIDKICAGVNIPSLLIMPSSFQGTIVRAQVESANNYFRSASGIFMAAATRIYKFAMERIAARRMPDYRVPSDYLAVTIRPPKQVTVDAGYTSAAALNELQAGATHWDLIFAPMGMDAKEELRRKAEFAAYIRKLAQEYGVPPSDISNVVGGSADRVTINRQTIGEPEEVDET